MNIKAIATLAALPLLAACAPEVETTINLSDVQKVLASGTALAAPATLRIPQSSEDDCKKGLADLIAKVKAMAPVSGPGQCVERNGDELAEINTAIQIVTPKSNVDPVNLLALNAAPDADGNIALSVHVLKPLGDVVKALMPDSGVSVTLDPTRFTVHVNNDLAADVDALPGEVFVDGTPHLAVDPPLTIAARQSIEIRFNDVAASFLEKGNAYQFIAAALPK